jgi:hypothetical protein
VQIKNTKNITHDEQDIQSILRYNPLRFVREAYVRFIQGLFHAAPRGCFHWELDGEDTDIVISDENPIKTDTLGKRPCISCTRAPVSFYTVGLDDMLSYDMKTGARQKTILIPGTMSINCCSRVALEAEQLAWVVAEHLWMLRDTMRHWGFYDVGRNLAIGSPSPPGAIIQNDGGDEWYVVTITSPFQMSRTSQITPLGAAIASSIETTMSGRIDGRRELGVPYADPPGLPYAVTSSTGTGQEVGSLGASVNTPHNEGGILSHSVTKMPHPLNPAVQVTVRAARPGDPAMRAPTYRGRTIPIRDPAMEESANQQRALQTRIVKT